MKYFSTGLMILIVFITGCENEKENALNEEIQKRQNQVPNLGNMNNSNTDPRDLKVMTEFTPAQEIIRDKVLAVIYKNLEATQAEDIEAAMETLIENDQQKYSTRKGMEYVFQNYDLEYNLENIQLLSITEDEARVLYRQTTKAVRGTGFTNTLTVGIHNVIKSKDGKWRILKTEYLQTTPIQ